MKKVLLFLTLFAVSAQFAYSQQVGDGLIPILPQNGFNSPALLTGFYQTGSSQSGYPSVDFPYPYRYLMNLATSINGYKFQLSKDFGTDDRLFFRTKHPAHNDTTWHEIATRGTNTFTGTQLIDGTLKAKVINVQTNVFADHVFAPDYKLLSLAELKTYIEVNKHLPDIPAEKEAIENGINVGEMNVKLLEKVEQLTLYLLQQQQTIENMQQEINNLKNGKE